MTKQESTGGDIRADRMLRFGGLAATLSAMTLLVLAAAACSDLAGPIAAQQGILRFEAAGATTAEGPSDVTDGSVEAPETVRVGERFTVTVTTVGLDGCWEPVDEEVTVDGLAASIVPFDREGEEEGVACTQALVSLDHPVTLSFGQAGEAVIRVDGRRVVGRDQRESDPLVLETTVDVVP